MNKTVEKLALEQGISEEEASELVNLLMGQEPSGETENTGFEETTSVEDLEMDAINKDFDAQFANESGDEEALGQATQDLSMAMAKLKQARKTKKVAEGLSPEDPKKQELMNVQNRILEQEGNNPNVNEESLAVGFAATEALIADSPQMTEEEMEAVYKSNMGLNDEATRMFASWADPRFGVPEEEGKIYRSWVNPRYFKTAAGNFYKLSLEERYIDAEQEPGGYDNPVSPASPPSVNPTSESPVTEHSSEHNLDEQEKQRLSQLMADAEGQGTTSFKLLGLVSGFLGDQKMLGIGSSQQEISEMQEGFRLGQQARGGSSGATSPTVAVRNGRLIVN